MSAFNVTSGLIVSAVCVCVISILFCGVRAVAFSTKLPRPFLTVCKIILATDIALMLLTGIQPWAFGYNRYEQEFVGVCAVLATLATTIFSLERVIALKSPLKYLGFSGYYKKVSLIAGMIFGVAVFMYVCMRCFVCYGVRRTLSPSECITYQSNCLLTMETAFILAFSACFIVVCHTTGTTRRQHTRRITRMGLPQNHAINAADTRCSAIIFIIYPCGMLLAASSVVLIYWPFFGDEIISTWLSVACRIVICCIHCILFNFWFDEWRLHMLILISPLNAYFREWANTMRINVYNIVIAQAFHGSRLQIDGSDKSQRTSRCNVSKISNVSGTSSFSLSQKSFSSSMLEQAQRTRVSKLENIEETDA